MTVTPPEAGQDPQAARREAEVRALEAAAVAAVTGALAAQMARFVGELTAGFARLAATDPAGWLRLRLSIARRLRAVRVDLEGAIGRVLDRAVTVGVEQASRDVRAAGGRAVPVTSVLRPAPQAQRGAVTQPVPRPPVTLPVPTVPRQRPAAQAPTSPVPSVPQTRPLPAAPAAPPRYDPREDDLIRRTLDDVDRQVRVKLDNAARVIETAPINTPAQLDAATARVDAVTSEAAAATGTAVTRAVAGGVAAVAEARGVDMVWVTETGACLNCMGMDGAVASPGGLFRPTAVYAPRPMPWLADGITAPPAHKSCRCSLRVATEGLSEALQREAARSVAYGASDYDSLPARLKALDAVLRSTRIPATVRRRAANSRTRGAFDAQRRAAVTGRKAG